MLHHLSAAYKIRPSDVIGLGQSTNWSIGRTVVIYEFDMAVLYIGREAEAESSESKDKDKPKKPGGIQNKNVNRDTQAQLRKAMAAMNKGK